MEAVITKHIMIVEDDISLAQWFSDYLIEQDYLVTIVSRGDIAIELIEEDKPDMVLLDIMLPVKDGFDVCKAVRSFYQGPILMMTARDQETDEVLGLELGADDYLTKPVKPRILLSRIKALFRRYTVSEAIAANTEPANSEPSTLISFGQLAIDLRSRTTRLAGDIIAMSSNEFDVLCYLAENAGQVVSRESLILHIRGIEYDGFDRSMDIVVSRIRKKLGDNATNPYRIKTVWGKGYLFAQDAWQ